MADIEIKGRLSIDTGDTTQKTEQVKDGLNKTGDSLKKVSKDTDEAGGKFGKLKETLGDMHPALGGASEGLSRVNMAFKALLANPIVLFIAAVVASLALLYTAFANSFEGGKKLEQIFAGLKAAGQAVIDNIDKMFSAAKNLLTLNFKGFAEDVRGIGNAAAGAYNQMAKLTKEAQGLKKEQLANDLDQAERQKRLAILREQSMDESIPLAKRKAALLELKKDAEENAKGDIELNNRVTANKIAQLTLQKDGAEKNQEEINRLKIEQINSETNNANELRRIGKQVAAAERQEYEEAKLRAEEAATEAKRLINEKYQAELDAYNARKSLRQKEHQEIIDSYKTLGQREAEQLKLAAEEKKKDQEFFNKWNESSLAKRIEAELKAAADKQLYDQQAASAAIYQAEREAEGRRNAAYSIGNALQALSDLVGRQTIAGKALGTATALINTYQGASEALKQKSTLPSPFDVIAKIANVTAIIASGLSTVRAINSVQVPGVGGGGSVGNISAPLAPQLVQTSTILNPSTIQGIGQASSGRAYLLDTDIAKAQERDRRLNRAARLG